MALNCEQIELKSVTVLAGNIDFIKLLIICCG
ncbi:hypothetical protein [Moorena sp. SIO3F7]